MESDKTSRFSASDKQKACYEEAAVNKNTKKSTETWLRTHLEWANEKKKPKSIENLSPAELDEVLGDFYTELKKKDGSDYESESLGVMQASLDRHLKNKGYTVSIIRGREFANSKGESHYPSARRQGNTTKRNGCTYLGRRRNAVERGSTWTTHSRSPSEHNLVLGNPTFWFKRKARKLRLAR